jgi:hypothetical protein
VLRANGNRVLLALIAILLLTGGLLARDVTGTVVKYEKNKLTVKVGAEEKTFDVPDKVHVHDVDGSEVQVKDRAKKLAKGTKVLIEEEAGKVIEINIKK